MFKSKVDLWPKFTWPCFLILILCTSVSATGDQTSVADELDQAISLYSDLEFEKGIALATGLLDQPDLTQQDRAAVYSVLSMLYYAMGKEYHDKAMDYMDKIMDVGPCDNNLTFIPFEYWNINLREQWYSLCNANDQLTCPGGEDKTIQTIAIMEFDNYSSGKYQKELGFMTKGLSDFFEADFAALDKLKVVERDKIDFILKEVMMSKEGLVDQATAIEAGKLLGAQIMVFGSVMQLDHKQGRMIVKAVKVETSEILATAERTDKPEFFKMERELVIELAEKLDMEIGAETEKVMDANGTGDNDAAGLYARGVFHVNQYEYSKAYDFFKQAYEKDSSFEEARKKMDIYRPLAMSS